MLFLKHLAVVDSSILPLQDFRTEFKTDAGSALSGPYRVASIPMRVTVIEKWRKDALESAAPPERVIYWMTDQKSTELALTGKTDCLDHDPVSSPEMAAKFSQGGWVSTPTEIAAEAFVVLNPAKIPRRLGGISIPRFRFQICSAGWDRRDSNLRMG